MPRPRRAGFATSTPIPTARQNSAESEADKNRHVVDEVLRPLPAMDSISGVRAALDQIAEDPYSRRLQPKIAAAMTQVLNTRLRAMGTEDIEQRLKQIETRLEELSNARTAPTADSTKDGKN